MDNLLERASIVLTPTAYNDAELLCVKPEDGSGDFDFSRNSSATRVNAQGLVEDVQILSGELVTNGDFSNGSTGWSVNGGSYATIVDGALNSNNTENGNWFAENISQNISFVNGKTYKVTFKAKNISGALNLRLTQGANVIFSSNLTSSFVDYEVYYTANADNGSVMIFCNDNVGQFEITNISVKEITTDTNLPRINYENGCGHLLFEPQSTNLITQSEDFSDASWSKINSGTASAPSVTANYGISPDGTQNASRVIFDLNGGTTSSDFSQLQNNITATVGNDYTSSVYMKSNDSNSYDVTFIGVNAITTIVSVTPQWQRFSISVVLSTANMRIRTRGSEGSSDVTDVLIWGAQLEEQSYATSYIPTSGVIETRNQDLCSGGGSVSTISSTEGVLYFEGAALVDGGDNEYISINDNSTNNFVSIALFNDFSVKSRIAIGGVSAYLTSGTLSQTDNFKVAIKYKLNDYALWINGVEVDSNNSLGVFAPNTLTRLDFSRSNVGNIFYGKTKALAVWKEALSDQELTELTTL